MRYKRIFSIPLFVLVWLLLPVAATQAQSKESGKKVDLSIEEVGDHHEIYLVNRNSYFVTLTLEVSGSNFRTSKKTPLTVILTPDSRRRVLYLFPRDKDKSYNFRTHYTWFMGKVNAEHNDRFIYRLPYKKGEKHLLMQGFDGTYSHGGKYKYALDFKMPVGTPVYASRSGVVVKTIENYREGGPSRKFEDHSNMVVIQHDDGTFGEYAHLKYEGALVDVGQKIRKGEIIALSGNTGYSTGPHLHFMVTRVIEDGSTTSLPFKFRAGRGIVLTPEEGERYVAR